MAWVKNGIFNTADTQAAMVKWQNDRILMAGGCPKNYNKHICILPFLLIKTLANKVLGEIRSTPTLTTFKDGLEIKKKKKKLSQDF